MLQSVVVRKIQFVPYQECHFSRIQHSALSIQLPDKEEESEAANRANWLELPVAIRVSSRWYAANLLDLRLSAWICGWL